MQPNHADPAFLGKRLDAICEGLKEAIRREVRRLRELELPVYIADDGKIVSNPDGHGTPVRPTSAAPKHPL